MIVVDGGAPTSLASRLLAAVRQEFRGQVIEAPVGHPIIGLPPCRVADCGRGARSGHGLCQAHGTRWIRAGRPELTGWLGITSAVIIGHRQLARCDVVACRFGRSQRRLCSRHLGAWRRAGQPSLASWLPSQVPIEPEAHLNCVVSGCELLAESSRRPLCHGHQASWRAAGRPPIEDFALDRVLRGSDTFDLRDLRPLLRLEIQYGLQCRVDDRRVKTQPRRLAPLLRHLAQSGLTSLLDLTAEEWHDEFTRIIGIGWLNTVRAFVFDTIERLEDLQGGVGWDGEFPRDVWRFKRLGLPSDRTATLRFDRIDPLWLRELAKRWMRWRLTTGTSTSQAGKDLLGLTQLSRFLTATGHSGIAPADLDRDVIEGFLDWLTATTRQPATRRSYIGSLATFLRAVHQHRWQLDLPTTALIYTEDYPRLPRPEARALSEFVATQLEAESALERIDDPRIRLLTEVLQRTGLRVGDARQLGIDCLVRDAQGAAYLRYRNHKMARDAHVPIDDRLADAVTAQQARVREQWPHGTCLFPMLIANPDGNRPISRAAYAKRVEGWLRLCDIRTESGAPATVTPHQWRHTYATRLINSGVPQHVVKKLLDHDSDTMTAHYARLSLETVRDEWEKATKVDITGEAVDEDSGILADAVWLKNSLSRAKMALPNGYCTLPLQQTCEYANACLTCPMFLTTKEFLPEHRRQLDETRKVIAGAEERGQQRVVEMNRTVETNLNRIILSLEQVGEGSRGCAGRRHAG